MFGDKLESKYIVAFDFEDEIEDVLKKDRKILGEYYSVVLDMILAGRVELDDVMMEFERGNCWHSVRATEDRIRHDYGDYYADEFCCDDNHDYIYETDKTLSRWCDSYARLLQDKEYIAEIGCEDHDIMDVISRLRCVVLWNEERVGREWLKK